MNRVFVRSHLGQARPLEELAEALRRQGAIVTIQVGVPGTLAAELQRQGQPVPPPQLIKGLVDTGASISTVSEAVAQAAGLRTVGSVPLYGVGGGGEKPLFAASFGLPDYGVTVDPIELGGVTIGMPGVDALIGRDILRPLFFEYKGPEGAFGIFERGGTAGTGPGALQATGIPPIAIVGGLAAAALVAALAIFDVI